MNLRNIMIAAASALTLVSCSGGGGSESSNAPQTFTPTVVLRAGSGPVPVGTTVVVTGYYLGCVNHSNFSPWTITAVGGGDTTTDITIVVLDEGCQLRVTSLSRNSVLFAAPPTPDFFLEAFYASSPVQFSSATASLYANANISPRNYSRKPLISFIYGDTSQQVVVQTGTPLNGGAFVGNVPTPNYTVAWDPEGVYNFTAGNVTAQNYNILNGTNNVPTLNDSVYNLMCPFAPSLPSVDIIQAVYAQGSGGSGTMPSGDFSINLDPNAGNPNFNLTGNTESRVVIFRNQDIYGAGVGSYQWFCFLFE